MLKRKKKHSKVKKSNPATYLAITFFSVISVGAFLLRLPLATTDGISTVDSFFISVSAVCVTGLTTVDVSSCFTLFGQLVIIILIQIGGLGLMTFAACIVWMLKERLSSNDRIALEYIFLQQESLHTLKKFIFFIVKYTFIVELIGAICFFLAFSNIQGYDRRLLFSVFHSISSFCNAGFSLHPDNFMRYSNSYSINIITCSLIVLGGLGFVVVFEIRNKLLFLIDKKKRKIYYKTRFFSLHTWMVLRITLFLIIVGAVMIYFLQYFVDFAKTITVMEAVFQSITCRTAGFNTVDIGSLHLGSLVIMIFLMFIGGSPGSTAGGIKTTTFGVLFYIMFLSKNNFEDVTVRGRTISHKIIYQALLIIFFSIFIVTFSVLFLTAFEPGMTFISLLFETVSAFGTVGLSMGITPELAASSKLVLMATMFIGRIGSLTIFSIIANRRDETKVKYIEGRVLVG